jgi:hypothetical protein
MWGLFKRKMKYPVRKFHFRYRIVYTLSNGRVIGTDPINITIPARSLEDASKKLEKFVIRKVQIKIF